VGYVGDFSLEARRAHDGPPYQVRAAGKLVQVRILRMASGADAERLNADTLRAMGPLSGPTRIVCTDCRTAAPLAPDAVDAWSRGMREVNARIERGAILIDPANAMFNLQAERAVRCAGKPERHLFTDLDRVIRWLDEALGEPERAELRRFLSSIAS
jgi:hypothetical protein